MILLWLAEVGKMTVHEQATYVLRPLPNDLAVRRTTVLRNMQVPSYIKLLRSKTRRTLQRKLVNQLPAGTSRTEQKTKN